jgi:hypothetical protein
MPVSRDFPFLAAGAARSPNSKFMKMQHTYGIFDDKADHIIDLVRRHAPLAEIRATQCPACEAPMAVEFLDATGFQIYCLGTPLHISTHQHIAAPRRGGLNA